MRKLLESEQIDEPVRRFLGGLDISDEASVVEINGRLVYLIVRPVQPINGDATWDEVKQKRRYELIDRDIDGIIDPLEIVELAELEAAFDEHMNRVAPLPIQEARDQLASVRAKLAQKTDQP